MAFDSKLTMALLKLATSPQFSKKLVVKDFAQLHQVFVANALPESPIDLEQFHDLVATCRKVFRETQSATKSKLQTDVARTLANIGEGFVEEHVLEDVGYSVDMRLLGRKVVVEVDGPYH